MQLYISYTFWKRAINFKSQQVFYSLKSNDLFFVLKYLNIEKKHQLRLKTWLHPPLWIFAFFIFYLYGMAEHGYLFLKSIISTYEFHCFFRFFNQILFVKLGKLRQLVTKYIEQSLFANVFASPSSINVDGSENYTEKVLWTNYRYREGGEGY